MTRPYPAPDRTLVDAAPSGRPIRPVGPTRGAGVAVGAAGLIVVLVGTFLPWVSSGGVQRDSYAIAGIAGRLGLAGTGLAATVLSWWPLLGPVAMVALIAGICRWWRTAGAITLMFGLLTGVIGAGALAVAGGHSAAGVALTPAGPVVTLVGGLSALVGAVLVIFGRSAPAAGHRGALTATDTRRFPVSAQLAIDRAAHIEREGSR